MTSWSKASIQMQFRAVDGSPVVLKAPPRARSVPTRLRSRKTGCPLNLISTYLPVDGDQASTGACSRYQLSGRNGSEFGASGSVVGPAGRAKTALASRICRGAPRRRAGGEDLGRRPAPRWGGR